MLRGNSAGSPPEPFRLARQFDGLDFFKLDCALRHHIVDIAIGGPSDLRAIEVDLERAAMVLLGPGRGIADALHAGRYPVLLLIEALRDVLAGGAAVLGSPIEHFLHAEGRADTCNVMHRAIK